MNYSQQIGVEMHICDIADEMLISSVKEAEEFSNDLHNLIENIIQKYCGNMNIEGYEPQYKEGI